MSSPPKPPPNEKKVDPGWNDPPMLNYSPANPPPKSRIMNKRVPFPISSPTTTSGATPPTSTPPQSATLSTPPKD